MSGFNLKNEVPTADKPFEKEEIQVVTASRLSELDLDKELLDTYKQAKTLLETIRYDSEIAPNQKVSAINSCNTVLQRVIEMQERLYNVESLKAMETALINALRAYPELRDKFLEDYKSSLGELR